MHLNNFDFLTEKRFDSTRSLTNKSIDELLKESQDKKRLIENIENEDIEISIKYRTYEKSKKKLIVSLVLIVLSLVFQSKSPVFGFVLIMGVIVAISSFFGILSNKLPVKIINYIKN